MTVAAIFPAVVYNEDGVTLNFPIPWRFLAPVDIQAYRTDPALGTETALIYGTDYTVTGGGTAASGTLTLAATIAGKSLTIYRNTSRVQPIDYATNDRFPAETHELGLDRDMLIEQEQDRQIYNINTYGVEFAKHANEANHALAADHALNSDYAANAGHAATADYATAAGSGQVDSAKHWTTPRSLVFDAAGDVQGRIDGVDGSHDHYGGFLNFTVPMVKQSDTFTTKQAAGANMWPRLNAGGSLDASLINMPSALTYKGTRDFALAPPANPQLGDLYIASVNGTVNAGYGPPAAGQPVKAGDWLGLNAYGEWQLIPPGSIQEAPADGLTYGRQNLLWSANYRVNSVAVGIAPIAGSASAVIAQGDITVGPSSFTINGYWNGGWKHLGAGHNAALSMDNVNGGLAFLTSATSGAANAVSDIREVGRFDKYGGFNVGTVGGDFGQNWLGAFRRDNVTTSSMVAVINGATGPNVRAGIELVTGTGNSFVAYGTNDKSGSPTVSEDFGSAVIQREWNFSSGAQMKLNNAGDLAARNIFAEGGSFYARNSPFNTNGALIVSPGNTTLTGGLSFYAPDQSRQSMIGFNRPVDPFEFLNDKATGFNFDGGALNVNSGSIFVRDYYYGGKCHIISAPDGNAIDIKDQPANQHQMLIRFMDYGGTSVLGQTGYAGDNNWFITNGVGDLSFNAAGWIQHNNNTRHMADVFQPNMPTSAASGNAVFASGNSNQHLRSTSSRRYKTNIVDLPAEAADALLKLRPVAFNSLCEADDPDNVFYGFVAEEVAEVDPSLVAFGYDSGIPKDNEPMVPTGLQYNEFIAMLTATVQRQAATIERLEKRLTKLEAA